jgi:hypothetical protein
LIVSAAERVFPAATTGFGRIGPACRVSRRQGASASLGQLEFFEDERHVVIIASQMARPEPVNPKFFQIRHNNRFRISSDHV